MKLSRRGLMGAGLALLARPASAAGCGGLDLGRGIGFSRADGSTGKAVQGEGGVEVSYVGAMGRKPDWRQVQAGVFEVFYSVEISDEIALGGTAVNCTRSFAPEVAVPVAGGGWSGRIEESCREFMILTRSMQTLGQVRRVWQADYSFGAVEEIDLAGCVYQAIAVEGRFVSGAETKAQRWLYFPDPGFGVEVGRDGVDLALTALEPL